MERTDVNGKKMRIWIIKKIDWLLQKKTGQRCLCGQGPSGKVSREKLNINLKINFLL